jgi:restriction system protein
MKYNRIMPGAKSMHLEECLNGKFIGVDFGINEDVSNYLSDDVKSFKERYRPIFLKNIPDKSKVAAGLACGTIWTVCYNLKKGDIILCPDGKGEYVIGEIESNYYHAPGEILQHRRKVNWYKTPVRRVDMSEPLRNSAGSVLTNCDITKYSDELELLIKGDKLPSIISSDASVEDASEFALEKHLEDFLVKNWNSTSLGKKYDIYELDGEVVGQQFPSDTGPIDILAISKDKKTLLVVELKKGRVSDSVVGQIQRYMGYVKEDLAEANQEVKGVIIGFDDDIKIHRALSVATNIEFYKYKVDFKLYQ